MRFLFPASLTTSVVGGVLDGSYSHRYKLES
jgi:hypothetical protein